MLLTLGISAGFTRRIFSPTGEDLLQLGRLRFSSGCAIPLERSTADLSLKVKGLTSKPPLPLEFRFSQPPEPPETPDPPPSPSFMTGLT
ncbi:hypothetical protein Bca52824_047384 [Brassica carinata]|uniref:Uncharacterized protein n=1 Tax=Brassica carinata TaxID=52824 RepID=A0A8X7RGI4_BRACI|nr:hypothetical protein Bca52824_047384 [Brassica carinata]